MSARVKLVNNFKNTTDSIQNLKINSNCNSSQKMNFELPETINKCGDTNLTFCADENLPKCLEGQCVSEQVYSSKPSNYDISYNSYHYSLINVDCKPDPLNLINYEIETFHDYELPVQITTDIVDNNENLVLYVIDNTEIITDDEIPLTALPSVTPTQNNSNSIATDYFQLKATCTIQKNCSTACNTSVSDRFFLHNRFNTKTCLGNCPMPYECCNPLNTPDFYSDL